ncbi:MAG: ATP-binding protein [Nitrospirae bacterium]|nr:MAG: ATP-binding protein [Nitrospirota bacterium]
MGNMAARGLGELFSWREHNWEVDFVVRTGKGLIAIEVKSGPQRDALPGMEALRRRFGRRASCWWVGTVLLSKNSSSVRLSIGWHMAESHLQ